MKNRLFTMIMRVLMLAALTVAAKGEIQIPYVSKNPYVAHTFEDKRYGNLKFEIRADGTGTAYVKFSNGLHLAGVMKAGAAIGFFDANGVKLTGGEVTAEVSDLLPGAKTKEKDVAIQFSLDPEKWKQVVDVRAGFFLNYRPEDYEAMSTGNWTIFTF
jgi:hypothetical protein